ncbi:hypothetical protein N7539_002232 [Penicillium diatomitis]|uniref:Uncharacterized protein n=1 Tax=Penicillium diatomitis TaxID=2819901 RepID=A0A9W9XI90_9EURO|nr:uncharacterized protein N7539_002232 [Penicillium diatomitis]KAJ5493486.1 hypothetical protein N7539_002232 [Penicillium diatomitis]
MATSGLLIDVEVTSEFPPLPLPLRHPAQTGLLDELETLDIPFLQPTRYRKRARADHESFAPQGSPLGFEEAPSGAANHVGQVDVPESGPSLAVDLRRDEVSRVKTAPPLVSDKVSKANQVFESVTKPFCPSHVELNWVMKSKPFHIREEAAVRKYIKGKPELLFDGSDKNNPFFKWGVRYIPPPSQGPLCRTVVISGIPKTASLDQVLARVRGGMVFSASLLDTTTINGGLSAMIVFVQVQGVLGFLRRVERDGLFIGLAPVQVRLISTPTFPMSPEMSKDVLSGGNTRCLIIVAKSAKLALKTETYRILRKTHLAALVEGLSDVVPSSTIIVRFFSIPAAVMANTRLVNDSKFSRAVRIRPAADPCAQGN